MGLSDYFGRFWFSSEPIFGIIMTLAMITTLRNPAIWGRPIATDLAIIYVVIASMGFCLIWGFADGLFYVFENYNTAKRKNLMIDYAKSEKERSLSRNMVEEDLEDSVFNVINDGDKKKLCDNVVSNLAQRDYEKHPSYKASIATILIDMGLNGGAGLVVLLPIILSLFGLYIVSAITYSGIIAVVLMFAIGLWLEDSKILTEKLKRGLYYGALGLFILALTIILGSL